MWLRRIQKLIAKDLVILENKINFLDFNYKELIEGWLIFEKKRYIYRLAPLPNHLKGKWVECNESKINVRKK